jgi:N-acetylneuraminic acid mutarotase
MYWSKAPVSGSPHSNLRAHTTTLIGSNVYVFGGCDAKTCFNAMYVLDADSFYWSVPHMVGDIPMPLRAMTCTAVGKKLVVFGGGDGPAYYNDVYVLDTVNFRWSKPRIVGDKLPSKRRAHTACLYKNGIYVFGGGDGVRALNDIWRLDVSDTSKMSWRLISSADKPAQGGARERRPKARGYHTANMVGSKLIIFGGSDGGECFDDVWIYDVERHIWKLVNIPMTFRRLSHTATIVGSYLFVIGGHDGHEYCNDVLLLNLVTMTWDRRKVYGMPPSGRGYHGTVLYDSRLLVVGGFDGSDVFGDVMVLELAVHAYYSQISHFTIDV